MKNLFLYLWIGLSFSASAQFTLSSDSIHREPLDPDSGLRSPLYRPQDTTPRVIYWIHGLAGNSSSWSRVQEVTDGDDTVSGYPIRRSYGYVADYEGEENRSMNGLAGWVQTEAELWRTVPTRTDTLDPNSDIIIGHSQGGIVARTMRKRHLQDPTRYPLPALNIATFGSPHGGAAIVNSTRPANGEVQKWLNVGCVRLAASEIETFKNSEWWLSVLVGTGTTMNIANKSCNAFEKFVLPVLVESIRKPVAADFAVGAPHLNSLKFQAMQDTNVNAVAFYGVEAEPVLWRMLGSMTFTMDTSVAGSILSTNPFGLNDDDALPEFITAQIQHYGMKEDYYSNFTFWQYLQNMVGYRQASRKASIYKGAKTWLMTANVAWKRFIGARFDSIYQDGYLCTCGSSAAPFVVATPAACVAACPPPPPGGASRFGRFQDLLDYYIGITPNIVRHVTEIPNDGLVTAPSQRDYPGALFYQMNGTNHMQMRNCTLTKIALIGLFDGIYSGGFKVPLR